MQEKAMMGDALAAGLTMNTAGSHEVGAPRFHYALECRAGVEKQRAQVMTQLKTA